MLIERISKFTMRSIDTNRTKDHLDELNRRLNDLSEQSQMANDTAEEALNKIKQLMVGPLTSCKANFKICHSFCWTTI